MLIIVFDVVKKVRGLIKKKHNIAKVKVGHSGTLDPKAEGLLVLCVGKKTKQIKVFENLDKRYIGVMKIGCVTDSFDSETEEKKSKPYREISKQNIKSLITGKNKFYEYNDLKRVLETS